MKVLFVILLGFLYSGCVGLALNPKDKKEIALSCELDAKPKSLQLLEQQYRCTGKL